MAVVESFSSGRRRKNPPASRNNLKRDGYDAKHRHATNRRWPDDPEPDSDTKYRNRALERSKLTDDYYKRVEEEYHLLKTQTEEESRYMGGDEEHTHLVKGLDYVLLDKVRKSLAPRAAAQKAAGAAASAATEESQHTDFGLYIYRTFFYHTNLHNRHFYERLNNTYRLVSKGYRFKGNVSTSKTFYTFDLNMDPGPNDIPSTVIFNDNNGSSTTTAGVVSMYLEPELKKELFEAFEWHQENRRKKKEDRLPFRPEKSVYDSGAESDDIFAGVGEYRSDELNSEMISKLNDNEKYFEESEDDDEVYQGPTHLKALVRPRRTHAPDDGYDECYPCAGDVDSDDDIKGAAKKSKGNRAEWRKIEKIITDKNTISMEKLEQMTVPKKSS